MEVIFKINTLISKLLKVITHSYTHRTKIFMHIQETKIHSITSIALAKIYNKKDWHPDITKHRERERERDYGY